MHAGNPYSASACATRQASSSFCAGAPARRARDSASRSAYAKLPYNVEKDFAPVGLVARFPMILVVNAGVPVKTLAELLAWARQQPGGVNYATPGAGSPHHLATELHCEHQGALRTQRQNARSGGR